MAASSAASMVPTRRRSSSGPLKAFWTLTCWSRTKPMSSAIGSVASNASASASPVYGSAEGGIAFMAAGYPDHRRRARWSGCVTLAEHPQTRAWSSTGSPVCSRRRRVWATAATHRDASSGTPTHWPARAHVLVAPPAERNRNASAHPPHHLRPESAESCPAATAPRRHPTPVLQHQRLHHLLGGRRTGPQRYLPGLWPASQASARA
jgi:hypothetical protein